MKIKLLSLEFSGVKCIEKNIQFRFSNYKIKEPNENITKVKSIYGVNGVGKTATILAMYVLKNLILDQDYLAERKEVLEELINKNTEHFETTVHFANVNEEKNEVEDIFKYGIAFSRRGASYEIERETLDLIPGSDMKGRVSQLYRAEQGQICHIESNNSKYVEQEKIATTNLLYRSTFIGLRGMLEDNLKDEEYIVQKTKYPFSYGIICLFRFALSIATFTDKENIPISRSFHYAAMKSYAEEILNNPGKIGNPNQRYEIVDRSREKDFLESTKRLTKFIQLFKPSLKDIKLERYEENDKTLRFERKFDYGGHCLIDEYIESTGVKRIIDLFQTLQACVNGSIVFIDELDTSISSIYLTELLKYLQNWGDGQLCFTSHNAYLMTAIEKEKYSINFINTNGENVVWTKNGHYRPEDQFNEGLIPGVAIHVSEYDFYSIFPFDMLEGAQ